MGKEETDIKVIMQTPPNQCLWWMFLCTHLSLYDSETNGMMESLTALQTIQDITQTLTSIQTYQIPFLLWRGFGTFQFTCKGLVGHDKSQIHWQVDKSSDPSLSILILSHLVWICLSHIYFVMIVLCCTSSRYIKYTPSKIYAFAMFRKKEISFFVKSWLHENWNFKRIISDTKHINHSSVCDDVAQYSDLTVLLSLFLQNIPSYCVWTRCKHLILVDTSHIM